MSRNAQNSLRGIELLSSLTPDELAAVEKNCSWKSYSAQEQIIDRQSDAQDIFFIVSGRTRVILYSLSGREVTLDDLDAGSYFGELAAIDNQPRSTSVMALTDTMVAALAPSQFMETLKSHPDISLKVMKRLAWVIRTSNERIMDLSTLGANNRVHAELLRQAKLSMTGDEGFAVISPIPVHSDIASRVSTTRETVARVLSNLTRQGIIERQKTSLLIRDLNRLQEMVEDVRGE
ncbi:MAG: Crp/Fnr family transcriptional regulator [Alphaproteobacteria bacterium]|nr:Crp/Fnr family transcriptional regulator [Rhodospirillales bacterium]MCW9045751.1 Crp/Fnr family transcriptional regulator [Alphaproteobacteria bacterium]